MSRAVKLQRSGDLNRAERIYREILNRNPRLVPALINLGSLLRRRGRTLDAIGLYRHALVYEPRNASLLSNMGNAMQEIGLMDEAIQTLRRAIEVDPNSDYSWDNLGHTYSKLERYDDAASALKRAVANNPNNSNAWNNLAGVCLAQCDVEGSIRCYRKALDLEPHFAMAHSNILFGMNFSLNYTAEEISEEHRRWNKQHVTRLVADTVVHPAQNLKKKRLRVGFVSPDLKDHPVGRFLAPLFRVHNSRDWEAICYSDVLVPDRRTDWLRSRSDLWREVKGLTDEELAALIRKDEVDILIDLAGHTGRNRLLVFARKPAPVQASWIGYFNTTGLESMDYLIADKHCIPEDAEHLYTEKIMRLPDGFLCYEPPAVAPEVSSLPALERDYVTFCSFNQLSKVSQATIQTWEVLLRELPTSRLLLRGKALNDKSVRDLFARKFLEVGIESYRLDLMPKTTMAKYFATYHQVDIALDSFPFVGGTTTCDSLWMGVPVVTFTGDRFCGRHSSSHIYNVGLDEMVGTNVEEYLRIAVDLANDLDRLADIRASLRDRCEKSPLINAERFYRDFTKALQEMWTG
jgi:protein O-GlcNAc transferase